MARRRLPRLPSRWLVCLGAGRATRMSGDCALLAKYCLVGASGYALNLAVYRMLVLDAGLPYLVAAMCSFLVAVTNNYTWNRLWTFRDHRGRLGRQGARFLVVSTAALVVNLVCLRVLVELGLDKVRVQALAVLLVTPVSFLGNKLWSFAAPSAQPASRVRRIGVVVATAVLLAAMYVGSGFARQANASSPAHARSSCSASPACCSSPGCCRRCARHRTGQRQ
jgi:putative flippase GtrA